MASACKTAASFQMEYLHLNLMQRTKKKENLLFPRAEPIVGLDSSFVLIPLQQKSQRLKAGMMCPSMI